MNRPAALLVNCLVFALASQPLFAEQDAAAANAANSTGYTRRELRITNRRWISHMAYERCAPNHCVTIITTHPGLWAWHADSHALKYACADPAACIDVLRRIDEHLVSGENLVLVVDGSWISEIRLLRR